MKILVLATAYPTKESKALMYVHTRNLAYAKDGADVTVLNFSCREEYEMDGIRVIPYSGYAPDVQYDLLVCHAPNLKEHYRFLKKHEAQFEKIIFFFHGHEVLRVRYVYPKEFDFVPKHGVRVLIRDAYDILKLFVWRLYVRKMVGKLHIVFVSKWMRDEFFKWTKLQEKDIQGNYSIIYNSVGEDFEKGCYDAGGEKEYDFISIRANLDAPKYCADLVNDLAKANPDKRFLLVGKGKLFDYFPKADNLVWMNTTLSHAQIVEYLNKARFALMPTKTDAQGLMMCEMATYGIPTITSDIPVCHEVLDDFENVGFISNESADDLSALIEKLEGTNPQKNGKNEKFYQKNTSGREYELFRKLTGKC